MIALRRFTNHIVPGRFEEVRPPSDEELKGTMVLALPLEEVSAKIRKGPPVEDEGDIDARCGPASCRCALTWERLSRWTTSSPECRRSIAPASHASSEVPQRDAPLSLVLLLA